MLTFPSSQPSPVLAVVEDTPALRENLILSLRTLGFEVWGCDSAEAFYREAATRSVNIVLIDLGLPGEDGIEAISHLRKNKSFGIIVITADGSVEKRFTGMAAGADHYFVKPVKLPELFSAIDALWRRMGSQQPEQTATAFAPLWLLHGLNCTLTPPEGEPVHLSPGEIALLTEFSRHQGQILSRSALSVAVFSEEGDSDFHRLEVLISRLRKKFKDRQISLPLRSVFGKGLAFAAPIKMEP